MSIFKKHIDAMSAYLPPLDGRNPQEYLLLDFNERTIPVAEPIRRALIDFVRGDRLQMYPCYGNITAKIADYCSVAENQVMITNGSDQGIELIIRSACVSGDEIIIPRPGFAMYTQCAKVENLTIVEPSYTLEGGFPTAEVIAAVTEKTRVIAIANPNNPSGTLVSAEEILQVAKAAPDAVILVDECYFEYSQLSVAQHLLEYTNIVVTRTFSKTWGLPSIRFGYILSAPDNINALLNVRGPYDVNQFAAVAVNAALDDPHSTLSYVTEVMECSKPMLESFFDRKGVTYWPSGANYLWAFPEGAEAINKVLVENKILIRPKLDNDGRLGLRITLGTPEQVQRLIDVLDPLL